MQRWTKVAAAGGAAAGLAIASAVAMLAAVVMGAPKPVAAAGLAPAASAALMATATEATTATQAATGTAEAAATGTATEVATATGALTGTGVLTPAESTTGTQANTGTGNAATIVVQPGAEPAVVRGITFTQPISGLEALLRSGLDVTWTESSFGPAVCAIQGVGCPATNCFCNAKQYWAYSFWDGSQWQAYQVGASQSVISTTGALEGWRWGEGDGPQLGGAAAQTAERGLTWLHSQQDATTGGYGEGMGGAVEVMLALAANGEKIADWRPAADGATATASPSLLDFVRRRATVYSRQGVAEAGKLAVAEAGAGGCRTVRSLQPTQYFSTTLGAYAADAGFNAWGIVGTVALSQTVEPAAVDALRAKQLPSGGWEWQAGFGADTNSTAVAIQALIAAGEPVSSSAIISGVAFLKSGQLENGGFVYDPAQPQQGADANSTAYSVMALVAAGENPAAGPWTKGEAGPVQYLLSLQLPSGAFAWQAGQDANLLATTQAVTALLGRPYPARVGELESCVKVGW